jgi:ketosteroid isomerase-like protein
MISRRSMILALAASAAALSPALAHSPAPKADVSDVTKQLMQFREEMKAAIEAKDIAKLKAMYADSFTHTHGSGKVDGKDARIVSLLAKEPVIEDVTMSEVSVRVHGDTAILAAKSRIQVYVRVNGKWQLAASQATRLPVVS